MSSETAKILTALTAGARHASKVMDEQIVQPWLKAAAEISKAHVHVGGQKPPPGPSE